MGIRISIIMGIYNCASTLSDAIESLLKQTYTNWELIMCDDGSTDDTYLVAKSYVTQYPDKIILINNEKNMGLNYTLNRCLECANGEYVARMDGDDISLPERFQIEIEFLDTHPEYAIVSTPMQYFDEKGVFMTGHSEGEPSIEQMVLRTPFSHAPCMVRREAYEAVHGYTVENKYLRVEDWQLWIKMYAAGFKGYRIPTVLYMMRDDRNAIARRKFKYRINEARVGCYAVKALKLAKWRYIFALRPIIVGLLPSKLYVNLHRRKQGNNV